MRPPIVWTTGPALKPGDVVSWLAPPPSRWVRLKHWLRGTTPPTLERYVVISTASSSDRGKSAAWQDSRPTLYE